MIELNRINIFFDGSSTVKLPTYNIPKPIFPTEPKKVEDPNLKENGKHKSKKPTPKGQIKLPW